MIEMPGRFARGTKVGMRGREGREGKMSGGGGGGGWEVEERPREAEDRKKKDAKWKTPRIIESFRVFPWEQWKLNVEFS